MVARGGRCAPGWPILNHSTGCGLWQAEEEQRLFCRRRALIQMVVDAAERLYDVERLRVLLYPKRLAERDRETLTQIRKGLVWLE
jgi:hypothetical protein